MQVVELEWCLRKLQIMLPQRLTRSLLDPSNTSYTSNQQRKYRSLYSTTGSSRITGSDATTSSTRSSRSQLSPANDVPLHVWEATELCATRQSTIITPEQSHLDSRSKNAKDSDVRNKSAIRNLCRVINTSRHYHQVRALFG